MAWSGAGVAGFGRATAPTDFTGTAGSAVASSCIGSVAANGAAGANCYVGKAAKGIATAAAAPAVAAIAAIGSGPATAGDYAQFLACEFEHN